MVDGPEVGQMQKRGKVEEGQGVSKAGGRESASEMIDFKGDGVESGIVHGAERTMGSDGERMRRERNSGLPRRD